MHIPCLADLSMIYLARHLLMVGPMLGATCAVLSVYVVLRRMALIAEGVSHAGFGGVSVALLLAYFFPALETSLIRQVITAIFCLVTALLMGYVTRRKRVSEDSAIGIFLVATIALGMLLISIRRDLSATHHARPMPVDIEQLLFGSFASIQLSDTLITLVAMVAVFATVAAFYYQLLYTTLDEEMARINGVNTRLINFLLLVIISLVIVICARMVGFLMITALTIIPGATANMLSRRFIRVMIISIAIGSLGTFGAVCMCLVPPMSNYDPGPVVVLTLFLIFLVVWLFRHFFKPKVIVEVAPGAPAKLAHPGAFGHGHSH